MKIKLGNRTYDRLKWVQRYFLPALGTLYFALSGIWGLPYGEEVLGTFAALTAFLGVILGLSDAGYRETHTTEGTPIMGDLITVREANDVRTVQVEFDAATEEDVERILRNKFITLKVNDQPPL